MALLILDEKCLAWQHDNFSLSSKKTQQAIIRDQRRYLQLIQPRYLMLLRFIYSSALLRESGQCMKGLIVDRTHPVLVRAVLKKYVMYE